MKGRVVTAAAALGALAVAGCGSSGAVAASSTGGGTAAKACVASIGFEGPITGPVAVLGTEQLHFAKLAVSMDNKANKTKISIVQGDTQLQPSQATTVTQQFTSNSKMVAVVGRPAARRSRPSARCSPAPGCRSSPGRRRPRR